MAYHLSIPKQKTLRFVAQMSQSQIKINVFFCHFKIMTFTLIILPKDCAVIFTDAVKTYQKGYWIGSYISFTIFEVIPWQYKKH